MREVVFRVGLLFFCLSTIANAGMGADFESILIRSAIVFFAVISVTYIMLYVFSKSQESEAELKSQIVHELLNDEEMKIVNSRIEERARFLMQEELKASREEAKENDEKTEVEQ